MQAMPHHALAIAATVMIMTAAVQVVIGYALVGAFP